MVTWDIRRDGHAWGGEAMSRYETTPEKTEMIAGKLYGTEEERLTMLALLLENVGTDKTLRIGNPNIWRAAVDGLSDEREGQEHEPPAPLLPEAERHALEAALLSNAHAQHEALEQLLGASSDHWGFEDPVYRFYHQSFKVALITLQADFNHMAAGGRLRLGDLRMHQHTPFAEIAAKHETIIFVDGEDMVRGELVHDPEHGWIGQVDWSTQDVWESYPPAVAAAATSSRNSTARPGTSSGGAHSALTRHGPEVP